MAYSLDFRKQAIAFMDRGHTFAELKEAFNIFPSALNAWRKLLNETGELKPQPIPGRPPAIDIPAPQADIAAKPDPYLRELAVPHGCPASAVRLALKRHNITYKKHSSIAGGLNSSVRNIYSGCGEYPGKSVCISAKAG